MVLHGIIETIHLNKPKANACIISMLSFFGDKTLLNSISETFNLLMDAVQNLQSRLNWQVYIYINRHTVHSNSWDIHVYTSLVLIYTTYTDEIQIRHLGSLLDLN